MDAVTDEGTNVLQDPTAGLAETPAAPSFAWGRFFGHLGSVVVVLLLGSIGAAVYWGWTPLERRTREVVDTRITRIDIEWPKLAAPAPGPTPTVGKAAEARPGSATQEVRRTPTDGKGKGKKPAAKPKDAPAVEGPWSAPVTATTWLPEQFQEQLLEKAKAALGQTPDPMSREPLVAVADAMERSGWFVGRPSVERRAGGVLSVRGTWRVPAAVVRRGDKDILLSWESTPMPVEYKTGKANLPVVLGVPQPAPVRDGGVDFAKPWPGEEIEAAMELLRTLAVEPWYGQVAGVDVSRFAQTRRLVVTTTLGGRVVWGGRASRPLAGEASTKSKLTRLALINRKFGRIDAGLDGAAQELEVFWGQGALVLNISATNTGPLVEAPAP
jgi:hypothetical protein